MSGSQTVIMIMYFGLLSVSLIISTALWWAHRTVLNRALFVMWLVSFVNFVFQALVSNESYSVRAISFMMAFPVCSAISWVLLLVLHGAGQSKMHWRVLLSVYTASVIGTVVLALVGSSPWLTALPITIGVNFPIFFHICISFSAIRKAKLVIRLFALFVLLFGLHGLDFFLLYDKESGFFSMVGFVIALLLVFMNAMLSNAVVITAMAEENVKREAERLYHVRLIDVSRRAGMAEVAAGVLHNVGNVLNSINISASLIEVASSRLRFSSLKRVAHKLEECFSKGTAPTSVEAETRMIPEYLRKLSNNLEQDIATIHSETKSLLQRVETIKAVISVQQSYARLGMAMEKLDVTKVIEDAIRINADGFELFKVRLVREFYQVPHVEIDRHRLLQILINLLSNAQHAVSANPEHDRTVIVRAALEGGNTIRIEVADNGVGIDPENMSKLFSFGFTTRKDGHGFGLHNSVNAATEMKGQLSARSEGPAKGASFILTVPIHESA